MPIVSKDTFLSSRFDYVIVGGGTSGLVLATRLSEDPNISVGVVEAGIDHVGDPAVMIPAMMARNTRNPQYDWEFYTEPQNHVLGRKIQSSRGKGLGGSSMLNNLAMVRPVREELDAFEVLGNPGWNWENILHYLKKSERLCIPPLSEKEAQNFAVIPDPSLHGSDGPISVSFPPYISPLHKDTLDSLESKGVHRNPESGGGRTVGSLLMPSAVDPKTATRSYSASAYLAPNLGRDNLQVLVEAYATKIIFEEQTDGLYRATAVDFIVDTTRATVKAGKEIILSAGTFQTPQLLEVSGIGDRRILEKLGINCLIDLPGVGENMQDHIKSPTIVQVDQKIESIEILSDPEQLKRQQELYKEQKGMLAGASASFFAFIPGNILSKDDVESWAAKATIQGSSPETFKDTHPSVLRGIQKQYDVIRPWINNPIHPLAQLLHMNGHFPVVGLTPNPSKRYMTLLCACTHPLSRGTVHVISKDTCIPPAIQPNYLANSADLDILTKTLEFSLRLYQTKPLADSVVSLVTPPFSDADNFKELKKYIQETLTTVHHPVGTASMLPREDGGVVDPSLLVYGTSNLRIVDCSVIPLELSCNIQSLAYAIGEKAAELIKQAN